MNEPVDSEQPKCLRICITLRSTQVFAQVHPLAPGTVNPETWGPVHEEAYGRTFDEMTRQGQLHDPNVKPSFEIVECPEELRGVQVHAGWSERTPPA